MRNDERPDHARADDDARAGLDREWFERLHRACLEALRDTTPDDPLRSNLEAFCADLEAKMLAARPRRGPA